MQTMYSNGIIRIVGITLWLASVSCSVAAESSSSERIPDGLQVVSIQAWPAETVRFEQPFQSAQILITGTLASGESIDLTRLATLDQTPECVSVSPQRLLRPVQAGSAVLTFQFGEATTQVRVEVAGLDRDYSTSFVKDVAPALSKMGCNMGTCHGAKDGQNGFKLSLRGYDYLYDHRALTDDIGSRRFNRAAPDQSLMLLKASGGVAHVGGQLTKPGDARYELLRSWIADGCQLDLDAPRVSKIELFPANPILPRAGIQQQIAVMATYTDGSVKDVTADAFVESGNIEILEADKAGLISVLRRGEAPVLVRYEGAYAATTITIMGDRSGFQWQQPPTNNYIDELVYQKLQRVKILPSGLCSDDEFIRRIYLDLTGLPPSADVVRAFLADERETWIKRNECIDRLVGNREFVAHWTNKWSDMLQVNRKFLGEAGAVALREWIREAVATNMPYDEFAYEILTATGSTLENPAAAYWKVLREPDVAMENTTHLFLSVRFNCNKCHDHPFERWTQDQYYNMTAFFAQVGRKEDPAFAGQKIGGSAVESATPLVEVIYDANQGETKHDRTGEIVAPSFPYQHDYHQLDTDSRRYELAAWLTSRQNRYFAKAYVNRLWGYLTGVGLIEPIDDIRAGNPATNPELLDALTKDFIASGFDVQQMIKTICRSRTYQHSVATNRWNEDDLINYSHAIPRRLPAEVLFDTIHAAAGSPSKIAGLPVGLRAAEIPDAGIKLEFLDDFGKPARESSCECERSSGVVLGPIMKLVNGPTVANAIGSSDSQIAKLVTDNRNDMQVIEELFLRFLARPPHASELQVCLATLEAAQTDATAAENARDQILSQLAAKQAEWEASVGQPVVWTTVSEAVASSEQRAEFRTLDDGSILVSGERQKDVYEIEFTTELSQVGGFQLELLPHESLASGGPGRADNGNLVLSEFTADVLAANGDVIEACQLQEASADFSQDGWPVAGAIDGNLATGWAIMPEFGKAHTATFALAAPVVVPDGGRLRIRLSQQYPDGKHNIGRFRIAVTDATNPLDGDAIPQAVREALQVEASQRTAEQNQQIADHVRSIHSDLDEGLKSLDLRIRQAEQYRLTGMQDIAWALINNPAFLFNR